MADSLDRFDKPKLELLGKLESTLTRLNAIWEEVGITADVCREREIVVFHHMMNLLDDMAREEESMRTTLLSNITLFQEEIVTLHGELSLPPYKQNETEKTVLLLERELRTHLQALSKEKNEKMEQLEALIKADETLSRILGVPMHEIEKDRVPTEEQVLEFEERIAGLNAEKDQRQKEFAETKERILELLSELDSQPTTSFEEKVVSDADDDFILSDENIASLQQFLARVDSRRQDHEMQAKKLHRQLAMLWDCLATADDQRKAFLKEHSGIKPLTIQALQEEVVRCRLLKIQNLRGLIEKRRREIAKLWDKCFYTKEDREVFKTYFTDEFSEDALEKHDREIQRLEDFYRQNREVFDRVHDTLRLWNKFVEFEKYTSDPNRLVNRGCYLLTEEKDRNRIIKDLLKMEQEAAEEIEQWEHRTGRHFLIGGMKYPDYVCTHWEDYRAKKDAEKQQRRGKHVEGEVSAGSTSRSTTPSKSLTPSRSGTPSKLAASSPSLTPTKSTPRPRKLEMPSSGCGVCHVKPLAEQNRNPVDGRSGDKAEEKLFSQITVSTGEICKHDPDETLGPLEHYQDFALTMNENYRSNCRSSVVPVPRSTHH